MSNIVDYVKNQGDDYASLLKAVEFAGLEDTLKGDKLQVFAPNKDVFAGAPGQYRWNKALTKDLLANHVTELTSALTATEQTITTVLGDSITATSTTVGVNTNSVNTNNVKKYEDDKFAVYDINGFLVPARQTPVARSDLFTAAAARLTTDDDKTSGKIVLSEYVAGKPGDVSGALGKLIDLQGEPLFDEGLGYTVFLPTKAAFQTLLDDVRGKTGTVQFLEDGGLNDALLAHAVAGAAPVQEGSYTSLGNKKDNKQITVNLSDKTVEIDGVTSTLNTEQIVLKNGQVHDIESVRYFPRETTVEIAEKATTTLYELIGQVTGLAKTLGDFERSTIFAPTNEALENVKCYRGWEGLSDENLAKVLQHHVIKDQRVYSKDLPTDVNAKLPEPVSGEDIVLKDVSVAQADVLATNGNIHVVDKILVPSSLRSALPTGTIVDIAQAATKELAGLVVAAGLADTLGSCATGANKAYTVFAPTDAAFSALTDADLKYLKANDNEKLKEVLLYHVIASDKPKTSGAIDPSQDIRTLNGQELRVTKSPELGVSVGGAGAVVIENGADNMAFNGVVHVIDQVLLPDGVVLPSTINSGASMTTVSAVSSALLGAASYLLAAF